MTLSLFLKQALNVSCAAGSDAEGGCVAGPGPFVGCPSPLIPVQFFS
uniref:Uncharacterized protein n=1 Tax=Anguilla anguilla TaxID=7936 RepID=A0A0E9UWG9_ANGAN